MAVCSADSATECAAFRAGLQAGFAFLSDPGAEAAEQLGILDTSDHKHPRLAAPYTFAVLPDLTIHNVYNGWWFTGRPTPHEMRLDIREMTKICRDDYYGPGVYPKGEE